MAALFSPFQMRDVTLRNRIALSPMCEYSSIDGFANDWHVVHLGSRAVGGAALVLTEAIAVTAEGRISPQDLGIWKDEHIEVLARIARFCKAQGAAWGTQLAHAGRKGSTKAPWDGNGAVPQSEGGWAPIGPGSEPFNESYPLPVALDDAGIAAVIEAFSLGAGRTLEAGGTVVELHAAHGYLIHQFLSPLVNRRTDRWGGSFENRIRLAIEVVHAIRKTWPERLPLIVRVSATDYAVGGWDIDQTVELAKVLRREGGVDLIDVSSGGALPLSPSAIPVGPLYQVPFAERVRREAGIATGAVGMITEPAEAEAILADGRADMVSLARESLRDPYWPLYAARALGVQVPWPRQYTRAEGERARMQGNIDIASLSTSRA